MTSGISSRKINWSISPYLIKRRYPDSVTYSFRVTVNLTLTSVLEKSCVGTFLSSRVSCTVILNSGLNSRKLYPEHFLYIFLRYESNFFYVDIFWGPSESHTVLGSLLPGLEVIKLEFILRLNIKRVCKQPIIILYFESETVFQFYNLEAWTDGLSFRKMLFESGISN